jgi:hypothetical protein
VSLLAAALALAVGQATPAQPAPPAPEQAPSAAAPSAPQAPSAAAPAPAPSPPAEGPVPGPESAGTASGGAASGGAGASAEGGDLGRARQEISALRAELDGVRRELAAAQGQGAEQAARADALERRIAELEQEQASAAQAQAQAQAERQAAIQQRAVEAARATTGLAAASEALAGGQRDGVDDGLARQAAALEQAAALARQQGAAPAAARADAALRWIQTARDLLAQGDLAHARVAVQQAQLLASGASALSNEAAAGVAGTPAPQGPAASGTAAGGY